LTLTPAKAGARRRKPADDAVTSDVPAVANDTDEPIQLGVLQGLIGYHLAQATVASGQLFQRDILDPYGLRKTEFSLLMLVFNNGPLPPKRLGQILSLSAPNLTMLLDRLQSRGVVERIRNPSDKRSQHIVLTETGLQLASASMAAAAQMENDLANRLSKAEHAMLIELLRKVAGR
jgi:DNA-binding MarR family transcriptional regulator